MKKTFILAIAILLSSVHMYAQSLKISFDNTFNNELLNFGKTYITPLGDTVSFTTLNYFISNLKLVNQAGVEYALPQDSSYHLLKHSTAGGQAILLKNIIYLIIILLKTILYKRILVMLYFYNI